MCPEERPEVCIDIHLDVDSRLAQEEECSDNNVQLSL